LFQSLTGTKMIHVPYKGTAPALTDLIGAQVDIFFDNLSSSMPLHKAGKIRILAIADQKRSALLPDVPTFADIGIPGMQAVTWFAVVAPPQTPAANIKVLNAAFVDALRQPDVQQRFIEQGAEAIGNTPEQMGAFVLDETARWRKVIADAKVTMN
jgi:tripartite-type tricarboxylate transporter receptor subunit TctC